MSDTRTLARKGSLEVDAWVSAETRGYASTLEFGSGLGAYTRVILSLIRDGIEAFEPYVIAARNDPDNEGCRFYLGDMLDYDEIVSGPYEVALFVDSLEHLEKVDGIDLLMRCQQDFKKIAVLVPIGPHEQEPCDGNELQRHLSTWYAEDLTALGFIAPVDKHSVAYATWVAP